MCAHACMCVYVYERQRECMCVCVRETECVCVFTKLPKCKINVDSGFYELKSVTLDADLSLSFPFLNISSFLSPSFY